MRLNQSGMSLKRPVGVLRLPRGPEPNSRGFDRTSPRFMALCPLSISCSGSTAAQTEEEQQARSELRHRFLKTLSVMTDKHIEFDMFERVHVTATFRASDIDILNFHVSDLQTPLGLQREALLRCHDVISCSFQL